MAGLALYRQWRPQSFRDVVGQEHVTRVLRNALVAGRFSHAYLFSGPRGTGKTSVARILAKAINCQAPEDGEPCNRCPACERVTGGRSMDVIEIDAASNRGIDEIRDLREKVRYAPGDLRYKVYIIDEVHMLTEPAFNALLKTLEEPPAHVVFVLATTEAHKVPVTIRSRCQRHEFHRLTVSQITERLRRVCEDGGFRVEDAALRVLARQAEGGMRDALSLLDQLVTYAGEGGTVTLDDALTVLGAAPLESFLRIDDAVLAHDPGAALAVLDELVRQGKDLRQLAQDYLGHLRDLLLTGVDDGAALVDLPEGAREAVRDRAARFGREDLLAAIRLMARTESELRHTAHPRLLLEVALVRLCSRLFPAEAEEGRARAAAAAGESRSGAPRSGSARDPGTAAALAGGLGPEAGPAPAAGAHPGGPPSGAAAPDTGSTANPWAGPGSGAAHRAAGGETPLLDRVRQAWPEVIALFASAPRSRPYQPFVEQAVPHRIEGQTLVLAFPSTPEGRTARDMLEKKAKWVEEAVKRQGLPPLRVATTLMSGAPPAGEDGAGDRPDPVELLRRRLGPDVPVDLKED
ncbi:DNA polymerase III subunit gamma/tau [Caldinitratiruptor microaerophilus]|uniref:DNA-directed DNA polymerase n=1 Tax=Caldinitratiruptor microaerophilus TaxID=671077 RepID=A0AA35CMP3_9FIRM|nr:DNA polymerase III subunit gamma/tau [Caldinitratiruptor microaerophilus]BDG61957.1 hypothetical protein caldi_30470 [Caldinitratiruptor microaerophilus]